MQYGNIEDMSFELEELLLLSFNFYVYYDGKRKRWVLCQYILNQEFYESGTYLPQKIAEFSSVGELFLHILQSNKEDYRLSPVERDALIDCINFVFLMQGNGGESDYKLRYHLYLQSQRRSPVHGSEFHIASYFLKEKARAAGLPNPKDASDLLRLAQKSKYFIEVKGIKQFSDCEDLAWWALDDKIWHDKQIARCKVCGQYFIKSQQRRIYCSTDCASKGKKTGAYLDEPEIKRLSGIVDQRFTRKRNSQSLYIYNETTYDKDYNEFDLFSGMKEKANREDPAAAIFESTHFEQMWKTYSGFRTARYKDVKSVKKAYLSGKIPEKQYKNELESFLSWLKNVAKQLRAFSIYNGRRDSY